MYQRILRLSKQYNDIAQCIYAGALMVAGDVIAQKGFNAEGELYDWNRTARMGLYGTFIGGPVVLFWFKFLERIPRNPNSSRLRTAIIRTAIDQTTAAPVFTALFFGVQTFMRFGTVQDAKLEIYNKWLPTLKAGWTVNIGHNKRSHISARDPERSLLIKK